MIWIVKTLVGHSHSGLQIENGSLIKKNNKFYKYNF